VGSDTDGTTTPDDAGYGAMVRNKKADFLGRRSLSLPALQAADRLQLVGLDTLDGPIPLVVGAQIITQSQTPQVSGLGHVTSSVFSPTLSKPIALGMLARGRERYGERLFTYSDKAVRPVKVVSPHRYDPNGARLHG
jgi:sarcosine oxidase, subunit alpha